MMRLTEIREVIDGRREVDDSTVRRLALRATSRISDPGQAAALHDRLILALHALEMAPALGSEAMEDARREAHAVLDEVDAADPRSAEAVWISAQGRWLAALTESSPTAPL